MTTPLNLLENDSDQLWKREDAARTERYNKQQQQDTITPDAASLDSSGLYGRLNTIQQNSADAASGAIASANTYKQYQAAVQAQKIEAARQKALDDAYKQMQKIAGGAGFGQPGSMTIYPGGGGGSGGGGNWGSGGAQGVANVLRQAGFPESAVPTMMAIAMAESSWNPKAINDKNRNGSVDRGLFQINSVHQGNSWYPTDPFDPLQSAIAAYNIWKGAGGTYRDWSVYNSGAYSKFLQAAPPIQPYVANTQNGLNYAQVGQAKAFNGVATSTARAQALNISQQVLSIPYVYGGNSLSSGIDCSGLVQQVYGKMGIQMPRTAASQATTGVRVSSYNQLQPGDLVAFKWAGGYLGGNTVSHISIYIGNGQIIEAAGGSHGDIRSLGSRSSQDAGAIYIHTRFPGE